MWMPTFDAAGMPTFVNPMQMANMAWNQGQAQEAEEVVSSRGGQKTIDRDLRRLASFFGIDEVTLERLDELMEKHSPEQRRRDLAKLYEILETARSPSRLLMAKTEEMEDGQFVTNFKRDEHIDRLCEQYRLNDAARCRLVELRVRRPQSQEEDHRRLEEHLQMCEDTSFTAESLIKKVTQGRLSELPDLSEAKAIAAQLDQVAQRKLREVVEKRHEDLKLVLEQIQKVLAVAFSPSMTFLKVVDTYLAGGLVEANEIEVIRLQSKQQAKRQKKAQKQKKKKDKKKKEKSSSSSSSSNGSSSSASSTSSGKKKKKKKSKKVKKKEKKKKKDKKAK
ncbi:unnamed protein product [Durusdinium trenchii]|uniref:Uncharacterized protein n=3 Tax=Durusdinium trenchii TaxID=1381693 RepID=A0ABP0QQ13_9DINO